MGIGGTGINILDRVGGGDAFASGLIYAMLHDYKAMDMINFAVASSAIKHTIHGDANITDEVSSIRNLMNMNYDIKRCVSPQRFRLPGTDHCASAPGFFMPQCKVRKQRFYEQSSARMEISRRALLIVCC